MQTFRDTLRYRDILLALSARELKAQYRNMSLGFLWALLNPLVMVTVLSTVFTVFLRPGDPYHPTRVVIGLIPYNFFSYAANACSQSVVKSAALVRKVRFPRQVLPFASLLTNVVHFGVQSTLVVAVLIIFGGRESPWTVHLLWLPLLVGLQIALSLGLGLMTSALSAVFPDTQYVVASLITVLFWASPIVYDAHDAFGDTASWGWLEYAYFVNPLAAIIDGYRQILFWGRAPDPVISAMAVGVTLLIGFLGMKTFWKYERSFAELCR